MPIPSYNDWLNKFNNKGWNGTIPNLFGFYQDQERPNLFQDLLNGKISALEAQGQAAGAGISWTPEQAQYITNVMNQEAQQSSNDFQRDMRDTALISSADQLAKLGLNTAGVLSTGGSQSGVYSNAADVDKTNLPLQNKMMDFQRKNLIVKSLLGMVSGMANAGIYGTTFGAAKGAVSKVAGAMANSAGSILKTSKIRSPEPVTESWDELLAQLK